MNHRLFSTLQLSCLILLISCAAKPSNDSHVSDTIPEVQPNGKLPISTSVIHHDSSGNHWFAGENLVKYDGKAYQEFTTEDGLCSNRILSIQEDGLGNLFFDTTEGVCKYDGETFTTLEAVEGTDLDWRLDPNDLWFRTGWDKDGPLRYDGTTLYSLTLPRTKQSDAFYEGNPNASWNPYGLYSLYKDKHGYMWFGTASVGVCRYNGTDFCWLYEEQINTTPGGGDFGLRAMIHDGRDRYWFCNTGYRFEVAEICQLLDGESKVSYSRLNGTGEETDERPEAFYFMGVAEDNESNVWFLSHERGVSCFDGTRMKYYEIGTNELASNPLVVYCDREGTVWVGTEYDGLWRLKGEAFKPFRGS